MSTVVSRFLLVLAVTLGLGVSGCGTTAGPTDTCAAAACIDRNLLTVRSVGDGHLGDTLDVEVCWVAADCVSVSVTGTSCTATGDTQCSVSSAGDLSVQTKITSSTDLSANVTVTVKHGADVVFAGSVAQTVSLPPQGCPGCAVSTGTIQT